MHFATVVLFLTLIPVSSSHQQFSRYVIHHTGALEWCTTRIRDKKLHIAAAGFSGQAYFFFVNVKSSLIARLYRKKNAHARHIVGVLHTPSRQSLWFGRGWCGTSMASLLDSYFGSPLFLVLV
jgi:hypothetical protein